MLETVFKPKNPKDIEELLQRDWLITNGLGGYASGTLCGVNTWKYHGLLVSAEAAPLGRMVMLKHIGETLQTTSGQTTELSGEEESEGGLQAPAPENLSSFRLELGLPVWKYEIDGIVLEKSIVMPYRQNSVYVRYRVLRAPERFTLQLKPYVRFRNHEANSEGHERLPFSLNIREGRYEIQASTALPTLRLLLHGAECKLISDGGEWQTVFFRRDAERGNDPFGIVWSPGFFSLSLQEGDDIALIASTENWPAVLAIPPSDAFDIEKERRENLLRKVPETEKDSFVGELVLAADQFLIEPQGRLRDKAKAAARGDSIRAVIAGYHWFTDWGRDTMISLEGLTLATGRIYEARSILRAFGHYVRDGLIPNFFPDGKEQGVYHTADATLWYFHALARYLSRTGDTETLSLLLPSLDAIIDAHLAGTRFGIHEDKQDGLLIQGEDGYQLTWMDAKVEGWVVTPRRGKAVEINALWHNALCLLAQWQDGAGEHARASFLREKAARMKRSFNRKFWNGEKACLYDVLESETEKPDTALRPNQIFAISLDHPVLDEARWSDVVMAVKTHLWTPVGLRTLAPGHIDYKPRYFGNLRTRDAAYHQGTVWPWLMGPFIDAWLKVHPGDKEGVHIFLQGFQERRDEGCQGSINEIFDAEEPFTPRGCIAQAWSVAEILRSYLKVIDRI